MYVPINVVIQIIIMKNFNYYQGISQNYDVSSIIIIYRGDCSQGSTFKAEVELVLNYQNKDILMQYIQTAQLEMPCNNSTILCKALADFLNVLLKQCWMAK